MSARKRFFSLAVAAAVAGLSGASTPAAQASEQTSELPRAPGARVATLPAVTRPSEISRPRETAIAVNPRDPRHLVVSFQQMAGDWNGGWGERYNVHAAWSVDGGQTWAIGAGTTHEDYRRSADPTVAFDLHGHAFLSYVAFDDPGQVPYWGKAASRNGIFVRRSLDGGKTWEQSPARIFEYRAGQDVRTFQDKDYVVADNHAGSPYAGNLYLGWTQYSLDKSQVLFARSVDDGRSWSKPQVISTDPGVPRADSAGALMGFHAAVDRDGAVYAIWSDGQAIVLAVSRDGGRTFSPSRRAVPTTYWSPRATDFPSAYGFPSIAIDPRGGSRLRVAWGDYRYGDIDILASSSDDGGRTWSAPVRVNDDPKHNGKDQILSWLTTDSDGTVYVAFYDRRGDAKNVLPIVTLARSTDGGRTFTNYAWSAAPTDPRQAGYGDYIGLAAANGRVYGAWPESVSAPPDTPAGAGPSVIRVGIADFKAPRRAGLGTPADQE